MLAAIACGMAIGACGSSSASHAHAGVAQSIKYADCMRANGVPNFPDSGGAPTGNEISTPFGDFYLSATMMNSPAFKAAQTACAKLLPNGGHGAHHPSAQAMALTLKVTECMLRHGVSGFPDPTLTMPSNPNAYGLLEDNGGIVLAIPSTINPESPVFKQAAATRGFS